VLRDGMTVVIAGRPNAGKSSLLNALAGHEAAIVTPLAGTTRDVLREQIALDGMPLHVIDTAGLRGAHEGAADIVEAEGIRRARAEMTRADRILFVIDAVADPLAAAFAEELPTLPPGVPVTLLLNKTDARRAPEGRSPAAPAEAAPPRALRLCSRSRRGPARDSMRCARTSKIAWATRSRARARCRRAPGTSRRCSVPNATLKRHSAN
jgi:small GTP-binding protein